MTGTPVMRLPFPSAKEGPAPAADVQPQVTPAHRLAEWAETLSHIAAYSGDMRVARVRGCARSIGRSALIRPGRADITAIRVDK